MSTNYTIEWEEDGPIAQHDEDFTKDVRLKSDWVDDSGDVEAFAPWEELIMAILGEDITNHVDVDPHSQVGRIAIETARQNLYDDQEEIETEYHADALITCLHEEGIIDISNGEVLLFQNPFDSDETDMLGQDSHKYLYNWAAAMRAIQSTIEGQVERAEELDEHLQQELERIKADVRDDPAIKDPQQELQNIHEEMTSLGDGEGYPDESELDRDEKERARQLKRQADIAQGRCRLQQGIALGDTASLSMDAEDLLAQDISAFKQLRQGFIDYEETLRTLIIYRGWNEQQVGEFLDQLIDVFRGVSLVEESFQDTSMEEFEETMEDILETSDEAEAQAEGLKEEAKDNLSDEELEEVDSGMETSEDILDRS